jgi:hypothetical protein
VIDSIPLGARIYKGGKLSRTGIGSYHEILIAPDNSKIGTGAVLTGDLEAVRRASGAPFTIAASTMAPSAPVVRAMMPLVVALLGFRSLREFDKKRVAKINLTPAKGAPKPSRAHARVEWDDGTVR